MERTIKRIFYAIGYFLIAHIIAAISHDSITNVMVLLMFIFWAQQHADQEE